MKIVPSSVLHFPAAYIRIDTYALHSKSVTDEKHIRLLESYNNLRTKFVNDQNWPLHESGIDRDQYDHHENNLYIVGAVADKTVAGLRLTPIASAHDCLSYGMWQGASEREKFDDKFEDFFRKIDFESTRVWDVTRLVTEASVSYLPNRYDRVVSRVAMLRVLAVAAVMTSKRKGVWVFTVTEKMYRFIETTRFPVNLIVRGIISEDDDGPSYFCWLDPSQALASLKRINPFFHLMAKHEKFSRSSGVN